MASLDDLLSQIPIDQIAQQLGVDQATAETAVKSALPTLVSGLGANADSEAGAASLESALQSHANTTILDDGIDISKVDTADGQKIVANIFGNNTDQVASTLGSVGGGNDLVKQLLPILAPIVLAYLAKQFTGGGSAAQTQTAGGGGIGDLLGGLLGGGNSGGGIGGALGGLLGGSGGGGIGDLLGGLLGGGKK
ncbi:DUF937 domain-containing protein [Rhodococcus sp. MS16]|uniref:DUF937 domain-containing protein n=1 Tax=Rhodococcus TaxID=1827 RepID=UPI001562C252|nr:MULTISPECIES: DUF937 domain-containing protein [unclassified Rhodococcus (in: high G+C Gram-positive bacteria)]MDV8066844.1 DUF937 domain-containing protein [Rhodococcus sp. IEGM 1366]NRI65224.1 DUF937 domain-containing protein [Rhodococcus sp. MS16]